MWVVVPVPLSRLCDKDSYPTKSTGTTPEIVHELQPCFSYDKHTKECGLAALKQWDQEEIEECLGF